MTQGNGHDPVEFSHSLSSKLASRSRHVCIFLGSGASASCGLPTLEGLEEAVKSGLEGDNKETFESLADDRDLEGVLSRLRKIASIAEDSQTVDGISRDEALLLDEKICQEITESLDLSDIDKDPMEDFARWAQRADYRRPLEVFSVNYDLLIEHSFENIGVSYFDGFVGTLKARFKTNLVEQTDEGREDQLPSDFVRLWKVHGSVNWTSEDGEIVRLGQEISGDKAAAIYPSHTKYDESRMVPYLVLQDRFRRALYEEETISIISGYSFGDQHINRIIFDAAARRPRSEFIAFCYDGIPEILHEKAEKISNLIAVGPDEAFWPDLKNWVEPEEANESIWDDGFELTDFENLSEFLAQSDIQREDQDPEFVVPYEDIDELTDIK